MTEFKGKHILIGVTGCIAAYKMCSLVSFLKKQGAEVRVVMTKSALNFVGESTFQALSNYPVLHDGKEESAYGMDHIHFARWADVFLIAPCTANTVAKLANGYADNLLTQLSLSCTVKQLIAPAMNPEMYQKPSVQRNLKQLENDGYVLIPPESGLTACGEEGEGRLPEESVLVSVLKGVL